MSTASAGPYRGDQWPRKRTPPADDRRGSQDEGPPFLLIARRVRDAGCLKQELSPTLCLIEANRKIPRGPSATASSTRAILVTSTRSFLFVTDRETDVVFVKGFQRLQARGRGDSGNSGRRIGSVVERLASLNGSASRCGGGCNQPGRTVVDHGHQTASPPAATKPRYGRRTSPSWATMVPGRAIAAVAATRSMKSSS